MQVLLEHPWAGAGVRVGMLRSGGIPSIENKCQSCQVSKFESLNVPNFVNYQLSRFQAFKDSKMHFMLFDRYESPGTLKKLLDESSGFVGSHLFRCLECSISEILRFSQIICS